MQEILTHMYDKTHKVALTCKRPACVRASMQGYASIIYRTDEKRTTLSKGLAITPQLQSILGKCASAAFA